MFNVKLTKRLTIFLLLLFLTTGLILRLLYFDTITFGYDQARDALEAISIIKERDIKIIGPTTDIRGLFHSPLYWYIVSPFYYFSGGNPEMAKIPMIFISILNILFIYFLAKKIFNNKKIALISALLMAVSFESIQYARWLANPPPALLTTAVFFYGLWLVTKRKTIGLPLMIFFWSLSVAFQFFLLYQGIFIIFAFFYLWTKEKKIIIQSLKQYYWLYLLSILSFSFFYGLAEIKFQFLGLRSLLDFISQHNQTTVPLWPKILNFIHALVKNTAYQITAGNLILARLALVFLLGSVIYYFVKKSKFTPVLLFLFIWLISPVVIYPFEKNNSYFLNIGNLYPLILLTVFILLKMGERLGKWETGFLILTIGAIVVTNLYLIISKNKNGEVLFSVQNRQILNDEIKIMDWVYEESNFRHFSINSVTNPLYINTTWGYLFNWYGKPRFGYMPAWAGYPQEGFFGEKISYGKVGKDEKLLYLIIEPTPGIPEEYIFAFSKFEDSRSKLIERKKIGTFTIEKRIFTKDKPFSRDEVFELSKKYQKI